MNSFEKFNQAPQVPIDGEASSENEQSSEDSAGDSVEGIPTGEGMPLAPEAESAIERRNEFRKAYTQKIRMALQEKKIPRKYAERSLHFAYRMKDFPEGVDPIKYAEDLSESEIVRMEKIVEDLKAAEKKAREIAADVDSRLQECDDMIEEIRASRENGTEHPEYKFYDYYLQQYEDIILEKNQADQNVEGVVAFKRLIDNSLLFWGLSGPKNDSIAEMVHEALWDIGVDDAELPINPKLESEPVNDLKPETGESPNDTHPLAA